MNLFKNNCNKIIIAKNSVRVFGNIVDSLVFFLSGNQNDNLNKIAKETEIFIENKEAEIKVRFIKDIIFSLRENENSEEIQFGVLYGNDKKLLHSHLNILLEFKEQIICNRNISIILEPIDMLTFHLSLAKLLIPSDFHSSFSLPLANESADQAIKYAKEIGNPVLYVDALHQKGMICFNSGKNSEAIKNYDKALDVAKYIKNKNVRANAFASILCDQAPPLAKLKEIDRAEKNLILSANAAKELVTSERLACTRTWQGFVKIMKKDYEKAHHFFDDPVFHTNDDYFAPSHLLQVIRYKYISINYALDGNHIEAEKNLIYSKKLCEKSSFSHQMEQLNEIKIFDNIDLNEMF